MSYSQLKKSQDELDKIFSNKSKITKIRDYDDKNLNVILSSENFIGSLKPVLERMLKSELDDLKVVLIPNAGIGTEKMQMSYSYLEQFTTLNNMYLKQLDIERWPKSLILESLKRCDVISFSGGLASRLLKAIDDIEIREYIVKIIRSGKPFVGFSAGAMTLPKTTYFARHFMGEQDVEIENVSPLGIIDFEVYPHFEDIMLPAVKSMIPNDLNVEAYAMRDYDALIITGGELLQAGNPIKI